jgi:hypothetical protein
MDPSATGPAPGEASLLYACLPGRDLTAPPAISHHLRLLQGVNVAETPYAEWIAVLSMTDKEDDTGIDIDGPLTRLQVAQKAFEAAGEPQRDATAWMMLGDELVRASKPTDAEPKSVDLFGKQPLAKVTARDAFVRAVELEPKQPMMWLRLARLLNTPSDSVKIGHVRVRRSDCVARVMALERAISRGASMPATVMRWPHKQQ